MKKRIAINVTWLALAGCYNYYPVGQPQMPRTAPQPRMPTSTPPASQQKAMAQPLPLPPMPSSPPATSTPGSTPPPSGPLSPAQVEQQITAAQNDCTQRIPQVTGRKAELVRCIVAGTDLVLDKAEPQSATTRHTLGSYAIKLAEQEDAGEITHEQAERLYLEFMQKTSGF